MTLTRASCLFLLRGRLRTELPGADRRRIDMGYRRLLPVATPTTDDVPRPYPARTLLVYEQCACDRFR
jgi:hypothetical protein